MGELDGRIVLVTGAARGIGRITAPLKAAVVARTPAGRLGRMEEVAAVIRFLATDLAAYVNAADVAIDGGGQLNTASLGGTTEASRHG